MAKQELDFSDVGAGLEQVHGKRVTQGVGRDRLRKAAAAVGLLARPLDGEPGDRLPGPVAGEQPVGGPGHAPPVAQDGEQSRGEHHVAVFLTFALLDAEHHPRAVDCGRDEPHGFGDPQAGAVASGQDRAVFAAGDRVEELDDLRGTQNHREGLGLFRGRDDRLGPPVSFERDLVEEAQRRHDGTERTGRQLLVGRHVDLVGANFLGPQYFRRRVEVAREERDLLHVRSLGVGREVPDLHVLDHALPKRCHGALLGQRE
jgi:hypothetical protein